MRVWQQRRGHQAGRWILVLNTVLVADLWYERVQFWIVGWLR
jgi:hypothetical protein